jgi:biotin transport system substrate-specific component
MVDLIGTAWLGVMQHYSVKTAFAYGFAPFIIVDCIKVIVAVQLIPQIRNSFLKSTV